MRRVPGFLLKGAYEMILAQAGHPESRTLQAAIYRYMDSQEFRLEHKIAPEVVRELVK